MKKRKFAEGGYQDMSPDDVADMKAMRRATRAYDEAMPEPDTTFGKLKRGASGKLPPPPRRSPPGRYDSIRPEGFEDKIKAGKLDALKQGLGGAGQVAKQAALTAIPGGVLAADPYEGARGMKKMRGAYDKFKAASEIGDAADREMSNQIRRETRGVEYKKGGSVSSASSRADGCAERGKTKGTMIMCGGGMARGK
jgi:hypothetical protein